MRQVALARSMVFLLSLILVGLSFVPSTFASTARPWGSAASPSPPRIYLYAHANPVNGIDPSGREFNFFALSVASGASGGTRAQWEGTRTPGYVAALKGARDIAMIIGFAYATTQTRRDGQPGRILYHYNISEDFVFSGLPIGTWLTDRGDLRFDEALSITFQSGQRLYMYSVYIKTADEIEPLYPLRPGLNQTQTLKYLPPIRLKIERTLYGPNWSGPRE